MKQKLLTSVMLASFFLQAGASLAQVVKPEYQLAVDILKGKDNTHDKEWAIQKLEESCMYEQNPYLLNVLGISYLHGIGTQADTLHAINLLNESGKLGYASAYHNLGMFYKYNIREKQDFKKAYEAFKKGSDIGYPTCLYNCGFMLYKGLGCSQNYEEAISLFSKAADFGHPASLYMLGLCYKNGYGVEPDTVIANAYLRQSSDLGFEYAMEELMKPEPENSMYNQYISLGSENEVPTEMPSIVPFIPAIKENIAGHYQGVLVTYDWSGKNVISEKPLTLNISIDADTAKGKWIQGNDTIPFVSQIRKDGKMYFNRTEAELYDRYSVNFKSNYKFENIDIDCHNNQILGSLRMYSVTEQEPDRPMYVSLSRCDYPLDSISVEQRGKINAYPNPFTSQVYLHIDLPEDVPSVTISVYTRTGLNVLNYKYGSLEAGNHSFCLNPDLTDGIYSVNINAGPYIFHGIMIKER